MKIKSDGITFDDVLIEPLYSKILPSDVIVRGILTKNIRIACPLISSPMDTVTESRMANAMRANGGMGIIHRNMSIEQQIAEFKAVEPTYASYTGVAVGVGDSHKERVERLKDTGARIFVIDSAHGHSKSVGDMVRFIKGLDLVCIAGNIATTEGTKFLINCGADAIKVGIGPGSICTTRIVSGVGVPQITAIMNAYQAAAPDGIPIIADGGLRNSGDIVKALAAGASTVMIGSIFAGTDESPGAIVEMDGKKYKQYRGMGSPAAMSKGSSDRYGGNNSNKVVPEGVEGLVPYKGSVNNKIQELIGGIRSGMGYCGVKYITDLHKYATFIKVSKAAVIESHPHNIIIN